MNLGLLDNFVCEYLFDRGYLTNTNSVGMRALNSNKKQVDLLQNIKTSLLEGDIEAVISQLASLDHLLLEKNKALLFSLQLHHFKEILYKKGREEALTFLREVLVHLALISTSTSYEEFKSQMTLLLDDEETLKETLPKEREKLVSSVHTPILKSLQIEETLFTNILAYLVYIHNYKHVMTGTTTEYPEIEQILRGETTHVDPGEIIRFREQEPERFQEISNNLQENDVRLLCESVHIGREQALQSLILSNNDLQSAFRREIKRIQLNHDFLSKLCLQYAQFRGLIQKNKNENENENEKEKEKEKETEKLNEKENEKVLERLKEIRLFLEQPTNLEENTEEEIDEKTKIEIENDNENENEKEKEKENGNENKMNIENEIEIENENVQEEEKVNEEEKEKEKEKEKKKYYRSDELKEIYCEIENLNKEFWEKNHDLFFEFNVILILELIKEKKNEVAIELIKEISRKQISNQKKQEKSIKQLMLIAVLYDHSFDFKKENNSTLRDCIIEIQQSIDYKQIALNLFNGLTESINVGKSAFQQMVQYLIKTFHEATETGLSSNRFIKVLRLDELSKPDSSNEQKTTGNSNENENQNQNTNENNNNVNNNDNNLNDNDNINEPERQILTEEDHIVQQMMDMMSMSREDATTVLSNNGFDINLAINSLFN
ncbi:ran-binding protein in the microtubule-organising centre protein [Anaeramoeba flamelloides]|uniref:Ran-binding protein in the microtubule-organising centre protein n=1 Tax=Anaeramoeba flamelloides TaxID=1746091 RepID=A0ABQ8YEL1_9EUKA|nr:ran-binding protein in the microtubule-organising centre protein [Anaeramoeba flamelloides]